MGFFDSALKNIVKKAKPLLPIAAMAAAPMMWPKMAAFMGAGGKGAGLGSLLGKYMGKYSALPMLAKAPLTSGLTSWGLAKLLKQRNPERAALYGALTSLPFAFMKAQAFAKQLGPQYSAWDVLKQGGGQDFLVEAGMKGPRMMGYGTPDVVNRMGGPGFPHQTYTGGFGERFPLYSQASDMAYKTMPGMGLEDLLTNLTSREGFLGNEIKKGGFDWRAFMPIIAGMFGAQPDEEQMAEDAKEKEEDRMKQLYAMMANPYYSHVPESFEFTPYAVARGGAINKSIGGGISTLEYTDPDLYTPTGEGGGPSSNPILQLPLGPEGSFTDEFEELDITEVGSGIESYHKLLADKYRPWLEDMDIDTTGMEDFEVIEIYDELASKYAYGAKGGITELDLQGGGASSGPGTGTSDSIPAKLSDGEFVMTAKAVKNFGGGDRHKGAKKMYQMMNTLDPNSEKPSEAKAIV